MYLLWHGFYDKTKVNAALHTDLTQKKIFKFDDSTVEKVPMHFQKWDKHGIIELIIETQMTKTKMTTKAIGNRDDGTFSFVDDTRKSMSHAQKKSDVAMLFINFMDVRQTFRSDTSIRASLAKSVCF